MSRAEEMAGGERTRVSWRSKDSASWWNSAVQLRINLSSSAKELTSTLASKMDQVLFSFCLHVPTRLLLLGSFFLSIFICPWQTPKVCNCAQTQTATIHQEQTLPPPLLTDIIAPEKTMPDETKQQSVWERDWGHGLAFLRLVLWSEAAWEIMLSVFREIGFAWFLWAWQRISLSLTLLLHGLGRESLILLYMGLVENLWYVFFSMSIAHTTGTFSR
jgi:hypothetical protein